MSDQAPLDPEPAASPRRGLRRLARGLWSRLLLLKRPILMLAGTGAVLGGFVGWWNAYQVARGLGNPAPAAAGVPNAASARTLAVLPFASLGSEALDASFADGVGEELVHVLSRLQGLRVTGRRSALQFKATTLPLAEVARQLQVAYLVDGSVQRVGSHLRIGAQLVDGRTGAVLWSRRFEREMTDAMSAQRDLALQIASQLKLPLDASTLAGSGTRSTKAWALFMQAQRLPGGQREALYREALAIDPEFARAHVELAEEVLSNVQRGRDAKAAAAQMRAHLETALRIDPRLALAHGRLATAAAMADDLEALRRHARTALELDPADMAGHHWSAELALRDLRIDDALALRRKMTEMEPLDALARLSLGQLLRLAQRPAEALTWLDQALVLEPDWPSALFEKALTLLALGRRDEALAIARRPNPWVEVFALAGSKEDLDNVRRGSGLSEHQRAALALVDGRFDDFLEHFEKDHSSFMERNAALLDPSLDPVRTQPRFRAWLARYCMEEQHDRAQAWRAASRPPR